jgi:putative phosphoesterase
MKIGILADLHGNIEAWRAVINGVFKDADQILCAGDSFGAGFGDPSAPSYQPQKLKEFLLNSRAPVIMVRGNCDPKGLYPDSLTGECGGYRYYLCHGQHCPNDGEKIALAKKYNAKVFIYGHTHEWRLEKKDGVVVINPGSPTVPARVPKHDTVALWTDEFVTIVDIHSGDEVGRMTGI